MTKRISRWTLTALSLMGGVAVVSGQTPKPVPPAPAPTQSTNTQSQTPPVFRASTNYVYNDIKVVDAKGQFVPTLLPADFKIYEDGVEQKMQFFQAVIGGRTFQPAITFSATPTDSGLILPTARPPVDTSGRIFVVFIDDLHLQTADTPITKRVLEYMRDTLLHDGDEITIVSTGYSGLDGYNLMYYYQHNHSRLDDAINRVYGSGMTPEEIVNASQTETGPAGLRYDMDTAFRTAYLILDQLGQITNRRKAFVYVSSGYDLDPFKDARLDAQMNGYNNLNKPGDAMTDSQPTTPGQPNAPSQNALINNPYSSQIGEFSETDMFKELAELIRAAKRADTVFYTVDPRGLVSSLPPGMISLTPQEWEDYVTMSTSTLRALADDTGGFCGCNTNDFKSFFQKVDADFSDYYEIGYYSSDVDPLRRVRKIEIKVTRPGLRVIQHRDSYSLKPAGEVTQKPAKPIKK